MNTVEIKDVWRNGWRSGLHLASRTVARVVLHFRREEVVVLTHTPGEWCKIGTLYRFREGHPLFLITSIRSTSPTALYGGGHALCWEVMGKRINEQNTVDHRTPSFGESSRSAP
jgi:hypothetical protein